MCWSCDASCRTRYTVLRWATRCRSPTASALIRPAAARYRSSSTGETPRTSAMLSKPYAESSGGSSEATSTSSASRSRIALAYSARFKRCSSGRPGLGCATAARSSSCSSQRRSTRRRRPRRAAARPAAASCRPAACARPSPRPPPGRRRARGRSFERDARRLEALVVARDAVLGDLGLMPARRGGRGNGSRLWRARRLWRDGKQHERERQQGHRAQPPCALSRTAGCALRVPPGPWSSSHVLPATFCSNFQPLPARAWLVAQWASARTPSARRSFRRID